jgi:hypothetical protein
MAEPWMHTQQIVQNGRRLAVAVLARQFGGEIS